MKNDQVLPIFQTLFQLGLHQQEFLPFASRSGGRIVIDFLLKTVLFFLDCALIRILRIESTPQRTLFIEYDLFLL